MLRNQSECSSYGAVPSLKIPLLLLRGQRAINLHVGYVSLGLFTLCLRSPAGLEGCFFFFFNSFFLWDAGGSPLPDTNSALKCSCPQRVNGSDDTEPCSHHAGVSKRRSSQVDPRRSGRSRAEKHPPTRDCFFNLPGFRAEPLFASLLMFRPVFPLAVRNGVTPSRFIFLLFKAKGRSLKMHANGDNVQLNSKHLLQTHLFRNQSRPPLWAHCFGFWSRTCSCSWSSGIVLAYLLNRTVWEAAGLSNLLECGRCLMRDDISHCVLCMSLKQLRQEPAQRVSVRFNLRDLKPSITLCCLLVRSVCSRDEGAQKMFVFYPHYEHAPLYSSSFWHPTEDTITLSLCPRPRFRL